MSKKLEELIFWLNPANQSQENSIKKWKKLKGLFE